jgi:CRISPR-associated protein Cas2
MMVLICYDVDTTTAGGQKRLRKVAKVCENYGQRVQNSVFECLVDAARFRQLKHQLSELVDTDKDSLRFYHLGDNWKPRVEHIGAKVSLDMEGLLLA